MGAGLDMGDDDRLAPVVHSVIDPSRSAGYQGVKNLQDQSPTQSLRSARRLTRAEAPLKLAFARRLRDLGLLAGRRDVLAERDGAVTDGITLVRASAGCPQQYGHCDRATEQSLSHLPLAKVPLSALVALQDDTRLVVNGVEISIAANEMVIFRGDLCHAGAGYAQCNTRLHAYLDPVGWRRVEGLLHGCLV